MTIDLRSREPIMSALLSPTSLEMRLRRQRRDISADFSDAMTHGADFRGAVDELAAEAERAFDIGPIVLPDADSTDTPNPNVCGWLDADEKRRRNPGAASASVAAAAAAATGSRLPTSGETPTSQSLRRRRSFVRFADGSDSPETPHYLQPRQQDLEPPASPPTGEPATTTAQSALEQAQFALIARVRFEKPRNMAPSQLADVIAATSSVSKSVDVDDEERMDAGMSVPSVVAADAARTAVPLAELMAQQRELIARVEGQRPAYEAMMDQSVRLLGMQRAAANERYAIHP